MKKILYLFLLLILTISTIGIYTLAKNKSMTGIFLKDIKGSYIIIDDDKFPIVMSNAPSTEKFFDNLKNGDIIEITYESINETYPGQTEISSCKLIKEGSIDVIPKDILNQLAEMGYQFNLGN